MATILIVDDHVLNREFLMTLLSYGGHRLLEAANGAEGLKMVLAEKPDLVISDILMPNMDGYEFVTRMHAHAETADVPVIFYTATYREREALAVAQSCGVRWVLPKPSDPEVILQTVQEALGLASAPAAEGCRRLRRSRRRKGASTISTTRWPNTSTSWNRAAS
jgi:CheY-like chemotaxis protein